MTSPGTGRTNHPAVSAGLRLAVVVLVALALGLPLNDLISVIFLVGGGLLVLTATAIQLTPRRWLLAVIAVVVANLAAAFLPRLAVEEGHNLFLPVPLGAALKDGLPDQVYAHLERRFLEHFPEEQRCSPHNGPGCWLVYPGLDRTFDVSADSLLQSPKYSRTVDHIDFDGLADFRGGFVNRARYSWYSWNSDVTRRAMPFFVLYDLPKEAAGGRLCWLSDIKDKVSRMVGVAFVIVVLAARYIVWESCEQ